MQEEGGKIIGCQSGPTGLQDIGVFSTTKPSYHARTCTYLRDLAAGNRYPHCIWPPHALIGTPGHNIVEPLFEPLLNWSRENFKTIEFVTKGSNPFVEHFSAVRAEVPDPDDPFSQFNAQFVQNVMGGDEILFFGEPGSHGLANTIRDMANCFGDNSFISKCILLTDGTDPVPGFEQHLDDFIDSMTKRGMKLATTVDYISV
jgi:nicotinamidase-related amidase